MGSHKGFVWLPLLLVILGVLIVGGGAYTFVHRQDLEECIVQPPNLDCMIGYKPTSYVNAFGCRVGACEKSPNAKSPQQQEQTISVLGMSQYTDADFGFSFWYPSGWILQDSGVNPYGTEAKARFIQLKRKIPQSSDPIIAMTVFVTNDHPLNPDLQLIGQAMGGFDLYALPADKEAGAVLIIPPRHVYISVTTDITGGLHTNVLPLAKTIVASDPSVALSMTTAQQQATIQSEANAYAGQ